MHPYNMDTFIFTNTHSSVSLISLDYHLCMYVCGYYINSNIFIRMTHCSIVKYDRQRTPPIQLFVEPFIYLSVCGTSTTVFVFQSHASCMRANVFWKDEKKSRRYLYGSRMWNNIKRIKRLHFRINFTSIWKISEQNIWSWVCNFNVIIVIWQK